MGIKAKNRYCASVIVVVIFAVATIGQSFAQDSCFTPRNQRGECIAVEDCPKLFQILKRRPLAPDDINYLRDSTCGFKGRLPKVCCPSDNLVVTTTKRSDGVENGMNSNINSRNSDLLPSKAICGFDVHNRIYGGKETDLDEFPWMALIQYQRENGKRGYYCGGVLINSRYILTAAHCVKGKDIPRSWKIVAVRLGEYDTESDVDCKENSLTKIRQCAPRPIDVSIEEKIAHEQYDPYSINQYNDIALLRLARNVEFTEYVRPVCLPLSAFDKRKTFIGEKLTVAGWGKTESRSESAVKLKLDELLEQIFRLFDQGRDQSLQQDDWIEFLKQRLTNETQVDFAEQLESVAFCLCGENPIHVEQFYQIFNAKGIIDKLFRLIDEENSGIISSIVIMEFLTAITNTRPRGGFDKGSLERLEQLFRQTVGDGTEIKKDDFRKIVVSKNPFFTDRVFQIFDKDDSGSISLQEFLDAMHQFAGQSPDDKIRFLFKVYDLDGDGLIQNKELQHVMRACMEENGMKFSEEQIDNLTMAMFEDADTKNRGTITYEALKSQLEKHGGLLENLSISIDRWLVPPKPQAKTSLLGRIISYRPYQLTLPYVKNNYVYLIFLAVFLLVNAALFISRAIEYAEYNWYTIFARACGQCLNFNCTFILVLMLRQCITFLRTRGYSSVLPLDQHIYFHKLTGMFIFGYSIFHSIMHICNFSLIVVNDPKLNHQNFTASEWLFTSKPGLFGLIGGVANPTGIALLVILIAIFISSQAFVRRGGCFEIFYYTHLMYVPFWILTTLHGPNFWKWFMIPGIAYCLERAYRSTFIVTERGKSYISSGLLLPSKVTHLVIKRPTQFDFHPGDYLFVNIPAIAKYEWHPFTISSAPEQEDYMWLHIRGVGQWTNRLYEYFEKEQEKLHNGEISAVPSMINGNVNNNDSNPFKKIQTTITRTLSNRDKNKKPGIQLVGFSNETFQNDESKTTQSEGDINKASCSTTDTPNSKMRKLTPEKKLHRLIFTNKAPLEKSLSMPDIQTKAKRKERLLVLREYMRSESEKSFNECQIKRARLQSLGLAYLSPQNKSLAQSFRYMRHKPTIIAFKTPSLENCEQRDSTDSLGSVDRQINSAHFGNSPERQAEEGRVIPVLKENQQSPISIPMKPVNYPVGKPLEIYLDGPYGAPSSHIFRAQHAVLIATGIGVTPFASILQSIMHRYWKARHSCPKCKFSWASEIPATVMNLRKVDFFWINRDQRSFEWFVNLLSQLEIEQAELGGAMERFLEMHMYITSALQKSDMKAVGLQLALDLLHEKEKRDLITGLKTRTNAGRPNWDKVFKQISDQKKGKITVFYCGPPHLARILRVKCDQHGFNFRKEVF